MGKIWGAFVSMIVRIFSAGEQGAIAIENVAMVSAEASERFKQDNRAQHALASIDNIKALKAAKATT